MRQGSGACNRAGDPIVTIVTPVLERRLQCNQRAAGIGLVRFPGPSDEQPFAAIAVDWDCHWFSSAAGREAFFRLAANLSGAVGCPLQCLDERRTSTQALRL